MESIGFLWLVGIIISVVYLTRASRARVRDRFLDDGQSPPAIPRLQAQLNKAEAQMRYSDQLARDRHDQLICDLTNQATNAGLNIDVTKLDH